MRGGTYLNVLGIDPHIEVSVGNIMTAPVYGHLGFVNPVDQKYYSILADSVERPSPTEVVFKIHKGVKFHNVAPVNGRELIAADVLYSKERFRDPPQAQGNDFYKTVVDKMEAVDNYTFRLTTKQPYAEIMNELGNWAQGIIAREAVDKFGDLSKNAIGSGPYIMDQFVKGEKTSLKRNPDYFDKSVGYPDTITWTTILDQGTLLQAYKSDQLDVGQGPYEGTSMTKLDFDDVSKNPKMFNAKQAWLSYGCYAVNASQKPFDDPRVRQALWIGIDRQQFIDKVGQGDGTPMGVLNGGLTYWALPEDQLKPYVTVDVKKAKDLLTAAGYPNGFDMNIDTSSGVPSYIQFGDVLVSELKKLGINAKLQLNDLSVFLSDKLFKGNFSSVVFTHNPNESPKTPLGFYHKNGLGSGSWWHYDNPKVTAAIDAQNAETELPKRQKLVYDAQKAIMDDFGPMIPFYTRTQYMSWYKRVGGIDGNLRTFQYFRYSEFLKPGQ